MLQTFELYVHLLTIYFKFVCVCHIKNTRNCYPWNLVRGRKMQIILYSINTIGFRDFHGAESNSMTWIFIWISQLKHKFVNWYAVLD